MKRQLVVGLAILVFTAGAVSAIDIIDLHTNNSQGVCDWIGTVVTVSGVVTVGTGTFSADQTQVFMQDPTAGIMLFDSGILTTFDLGDSVEITGEVQQYRGMTEIVPDWAQVQVFGSGAAIPETLVVTCQEINDSFENDYSEPNEGRLVRVENVSYTGTWPSPGNGGLVTITDATGSSDMYVEWETGLGAENGPAGTFSVIGVIKQFGGFSAPWTSAYEILPRYATDIFYPNGPRITSGPMEIEIHPTTVTIAWTTDVSANSVVEYGLTDGYGNTVTDPTLVTDHSVQLTTLSPGTIYHYRVKSTDVDGTTVSGNRTFCSGSAAGSTGAIEVYFNKSVETSYSTGTPAQVVADLSSKAIEKINMADNSIDACFYSFSLTAVRDALINAHNRGVLVRFIYEQDNYNSYMAALASAGIPCIGDEFGSNAAVDGLMHNKFLVIDADARGDSDPSNDWIMSGSWNASITGNNPSAMIQNMIFIQDHSLATAYTAEFQEMWGDTSMTPSEANSRFGSRKHDNTPHRFIVQGNDVQLYFSPTDATSQQMANAIMDANESCFLALMSFTRYTQANALQEMWYNFEPCFQLRGVFDNSLSDFSQYWNLVGQLPGENLWDPPADDIHLDGESGTLHHKYAIIDANDALGDPLVITGAHNWSTAAETSNDENTLIIHSPEVANLYLQEFAARYHAAGGTQELVPSDELLVTTNQVGQNLVIDWNPVACGYSYALYRFNQAFGDTTGVAPLAVIDSPTVTYTDLTVLGDPLMNYYYLLLPRNMYDEPFGPGVRFGEFDFSADIPLLDRNIEKRVDLR